MKPDMHCAILWQRCKPLLKRTCKDEASKVEAKTRALLWCEGILFYWRLGQSTGPPDLVNQSIGPHQPIDWFLIMSCTLIKTNWMKMRCCKQKSQSQHLKRMTIFGWVGRLVWLIGWFDCLGIEVFQSFWSFCQEFELYDSPRNLFHPMP